MSKSKIIYNNIGYIVVFLNGYRDTAADTRSCDRRRMTEGNRTEPCFITKTK